MGIALDRYKAVNLSQNKGSLQIPALFLIFLIDVTSILLIIPYSLHMKVQVTINRDIFCTNIIFSGKTTME